MLDLDSSEYKQALSLSQEESAMLPPAPQMTDDSAFRQGFGERLDKAMKASGLTQQAIAERLGISSGAITRWRQGKMSPRLPEVPPLAQLLRVTTDYLLGMTDASDPRADERAAYEALLHERLTEAAELLRRAVEASKARHRGKRPKARKR
jgi:transcriptional regulator with XRE-family HTH domain